MAKKLFIVCVTMHRETAILTKALDLKHSRFQGKKALRRRIKTHPGAKLCTFVSET